MKIGKYATIISLWFQLTHVLWLSVSDVSWHMCYDYQSLMSIVPGVHTIRHHVICARSSIQTTIIQLFASLIFFFICNVWTTNFIHNLSLSSHPHITWLTLCFSLSLSLITSLCFQSVSVPSSVSLFSSTSPSCPQASLYFSVSLNLFLYQPLTLRRSSLCLSSLQFLSLPPSLSFFCCSASFCLSPTPPPPKGGAVA